MIWDWGGWLLGRHRIEISPEVNGEVGEGVIRPSHMPDSEGGGGHLDRDGR